ncbi:MAG TPA: oxidoreductase [Pyrinomonadaceae bacterium]|jgi:uncharacterized protein YbjT (DUF2867 family)
MATRSVLLLGGSGLIGSQCLDLLLRDAAYGRVMALGRKLLPARHDKLEQHAIDFTRLPDFVPLLLAQDVFCCLGTTIGKAGSQAAFRQVDFTCTVELARLSAQSGAEQFLLVSALGANAASRVFYNRVKGETEAAVAALPFRAAQIFRPSLLLGRRAEFRPGERLAQAASRLFSPLLTGTWAKYRPIEARAVAAAMLKIAKEFPAGVHIYDSEQIARLAAETETRG